MKFCKDCKHFQEWTSRCGARSHPDYISGTDAVLYMDAMVSRVDERFCGIDAQWFSPVVPQTQQSTD